MVKEQDITKKHPAKSAGKSERMAKPAAGSKAGAKSGHKATGPKAVASRKPRGAKKIEAAARAPAVEVPATVAPGSASVAASPAKHAKPSGKYVFATGRRKTAVATVRVFTGAGDHTVNKKPFGNYFFHQSYREQALKPFELTGTAKDFHFTATVLGGGINAQAQALQHGLARALAQVNPEVHTVLKRNGLLTRDDRKKERKKPGLKRARRSPQWAKR